MKNKKIALISIFIFCYALIIFRAFFVSAPHRTSVFGDGYSDLNTISSSTWFLDNGFTQTKFLPVHSYPPKETASIYTHYPALPNILAGFYATIFHSADESVLRIIPIFISIFFFFFIFFVLKRFSDNKESAFWAACIMVLSNYFIAWADNLHKHQYEEIINWAFFLLLYLYHEKERKSKPIFIALLALMVIGINISFEQPVFLGTLTLGFAIVYQKKIFTRETICVFIALLVGLALHILQNALFLKSLPLALEDMANAFIFRTSGTEVAGYVAEKPFNFLHSLPEIPFSWFNRMERYFLFPGWALLIAGFWGYKQLYRENRKIFLLIVVTFCSSAIWSFTMPQHDYIHTFTNRHMGLFYALSLVFILPAYIDKLKIDMKTGRWYMKTFHIVLLLYCLAMFLTQQVWDLYLNNGFLFTYLHS